MKKKNHSLGLFFLVLGLICILLVRHFYIKDFRVILDETLYVSSQPRGMDYARLVYKYHIATIANVRLSLEHRNQNWYHEELIKTKTLGIHYIPIPVEKKQVFPDAQTQKQFLEIMTDKKNRPVLLHGYGDDSRVAMLVAVWLRRAEGYTKDQALDVVRTIIDDRPLRDNEIQFIEQLPMDNPPQS